MRRMLRPIRLATVGTCLLLVLGVAAAPSVAAPSVAAPSVAAPSVAGAGAGTAARPWMDRSLQPRARAERLLAAMTLEEKVGQMTQAERGAVTDDPTLVATWRLGSVLSGGGSTPADNTPEGWADMVDAFQAQTLNTRLGIPLIYGVDSVHGHGNLVGATVFPHNIGLGATRDPRLVERVEHVTAEETPGHRPAVGLRPLCVRGP